MGKSFSAYLDLLRFTAALLVVLEHAVLLGLLPPLGVATELSHESVILFFVLSGLVIASSSWARQTSLAAYVAARAARVLSVALPALVCCFGLSVALARESAPPARIAAEFASSALFLNGVWLNYLEVPFNGPYWSLCHEVWYYAGWATLRFPKRTAARVVATSLLVVVMGPAFAALFGLWLAGAFLAARHKALQTASGAAPRWLVAAVFAASIAAVIGIASTGVQDAVRDAMRASVHGWWRLRSAEYALTDYLLGALVTVHLGAAMLFFGESRRFADSAVGRLVRWCASFTFTLYLFHYPMLLGLRVLRGPVPPSVAAGLGSIAATLVGVWLVSFATERQLPRWRRAADWALERLAGAVAGRPADVPAPVAVPNRG